MGHWRRSVLGAGGVAMLLPLGLAVGVLLTTAVGGGGTLRTLGQIFAGPSAPDAQGGLGLESAIRVPAIPLARPGRRSAAARGAASAAPTAGPVRRSAASPAPPHTSSPAPPGAGSPGSSSPPPPSAGSPGSSSPPPSAPPKSAAHAAGQQVADTAKQLPAPTGSPVGDAVQTVVDLIP
jgi:hypothetical protein